MGHPDVPGMERIMTTRAFTRSSLIKAVVAISLLVWVIWLSGFQALAHHLTHFPPDRLGLILVMLVANLWLVAFRFWRVLAHFGINLPWALAFRANLAGLAAGQVMISLYGQVAGRQTILRELGVSPVVNASLAAYERALLAVISGTLAFLGSVYLLGHHWTSQFLHQIPVMEIGLLATISLAISHWLGASEFEQQLSRRMLTRKNTLRVGWIALLTMVGQLLILGSFVLGILALRPETPLLTALSASAIISFAASMPITINGWGARELAAVFVLGRIGLPAADAASISIVIGLCTTAVILTGALLTSRKPLPASHQLAKAVMHSPIELETAAAWILALATAVTIFFQFQVALPSGMINLNLADPFAILALAAASLHALILREAPPWRIAVFNRILLLLSTLLVLGFFVGWLKIGVTQWALGGRLMGWLVLLGYLSVGSLLACHVDTVSVRRLAETLAITAAVVLVWHLTSRILYTRGWDIAPPKAFFEAYSGNRNALAFQLLAVLALLLAYAPKTKQWHVVLVRSVLLQGVVIAGLVWSGSRAGMLAGMVMILVAETKRLTSRKVVIASILVAGMLWGAAWHLQATPHVEMTPPLQATTQIQATQVQGALTNENSNKERWLTMKHGFQLWRESPLLGAGLGVFIANSAQWLGYPQVIHSTPVWILAELGLLGLGIIGWGFFVLVRFAWPTRENRSYPERSALFLLLLMFALFSQFHEVFYQRIFWLIMGLLLARPPISQTGSDGR